MNSQTIDRTSNSQTQTAARQNFDAAMQVHKANTKTAISRFEEVTGKSYSGQNPQELQQQLKENARQVNQICAELQASQATLEQAWAKFESASN